MHPQRPPSAALTRLDTHFGTTHRNPVEARESFLQMYAEAPKLAVWAANNHPQAFGDPTGEKAPRFTGRGLRAALQPEPAGPEHDSTAAPYRRAEAQELRRAYPKAKSTRQAEAVARSIDRLAAQVKHHQVSPDPEKTADRVRTLTSAKVGRQVTQTADRMEELRKSTLERAAAQNHSRGQDIDR